MSMWILKRNQQKWAKNAKKRTRTETWKWTSVEEICMSEATTITASGATDGMVLLLFFDSVDRGWVMVRDVVGVYMCVCVWVCVCVCLCVCECVCVCVSLSLWGGGGMGANVFRNWEHLHLNLSTKFLPSVGLTVTWSTNVYIVPFPWHYCSLGMLDKNSEPFVMLSFWDRWWMGQIKCLILLTSAYSSIAHNLVKNGSLDLKFGHKLRSTF